jgi:protein-S-isoprenylcysteine O-methyltransferase Ste14
MKNLLVACGAFLFRTRNVVFPLAILAILLLWPPTAMPTSLSFSLIVGLLMVLLGQLIRVLTIGLAYIVRGGRNRRVYADKLVTEGVFAHCRNPLYVGNVLIASGFFFIAGNGMAILVGSLLFYAAYSAIIANEEAFLAEKFGQAYQDYCARVPRWLLQAKGLQQSMAGYEFDWPAVVVKEYGTLMTSMMAPLVIIAWKLQLAGRMVEHQSTLLITAILVLSAYGYARFLKKTERLKTLR